MCIESSRKRITAMTGYKKTTRKMIKGKTYCIMIPAMTYNQKLAAFLLLDASFEREREKERERERERKRERERERETERQREREKERKREKESKREKERETEIERERVR